MRRIAMQLSDGTGDVADHNPQEIDDGDVSPPTPIEIGDAENDGLDHDPDGKRIREVPADMRAAD